MSYRRLWRLGLRGSSFRFIAIVSRIRRCPDTVTVKLDGPEHFFRFRVLGKEFIGVPVAIRSSIADPSPDAPNANGRSGEGEEEDDDSVVSHVGGSAGTADPRISFKVPWESA